MLKTIKVIKTASHLNDKLSAVVANSRKYRSVTFMNGYINLLNFLSKLKRVRPIVADIKLLTK